MKINPLIVVSYSIFWFSTVQARYHDALLYGTFGLSMDPSALDKKYPPLITACPPARVQEVNFNENVSIGGKSLFVRNVVKRYAAVTNMKLNICKKPITPVTFYDMEEKIYEIGYELYHTEGQIKLFDRPQDARYDHYVKVIFPRLAVPSKPPSSIANKYENGPNVKFKCANGSRISTLVFRFIPVWQINALEKSKTKIITLRDWNSAIDEEYNHATKPCNSYRQLSDELMDDLYSEKNQAKCLKNLWIPSSWFGSNIQKLSCGQPYGCLKKSQMIPYWYSDKHAIKLTYCTCMNFIPVWKIIADGQLKKVDALVFLLLSSIRNNYDYAGKLRIEEINFGVSGILRMKTKDNPEELREIQLWDGENESYAIPVPKIIFKTIRIGAFDTRSAIIILHNDPTPIPDSDRICSKESEISGWDLIKNEDPKTGLTYVCHLTPEIIDKLELQDTEPIVDHPLHFETFLPREAESIKKNFEKLISVWN